MLTLRLVVRERDPQEKSLKEDSGMLTLRLVVRERSLRKESQRGLRDAHSQTCSQTRRDLKRKPQGFRGYKNWIHQIRPSRDL